jgi:hypothetical protein
VVRGENEPLIFSMRSRQSCIQRDPPELWLMKVDSPQKLVSSLISNTCRVASEESGVARVTARTVAQMGRWSLIVMRVRGGRNWASLLACSSYQESGRVEFI